MLSNMMVHDTQQQPAKLFVLLKTMAGCVVLGGAPCSRTHGPGVSI